MLDDLARTSAPRRSLPPIPRPIRVPVLEPAFTHPPAPEPAGPRAQGAAIQTGFAALFDQYQDTPPDTQGAVGRDDVVSMVNGEVLLQSRSGATRPGYPVSLAQFWSGLGPFTKLFDPRLLYDSAGDRWIASAGANPETADAALLLAVSRSGDASGTWDLFRIPVGASGVWADYPVLGVSRDWIVLSANLLQLPPNGQYARTGLYAFDKASIYQTGKASYATFGDTQGELAPVVDLDNNSGTFYFAQAIPGAAGGVVRIGALKGPVGSETFTPGAIQIALPQMWSATAPQGEDFAPQSGAWLKVDTGDSRLQNCVMRGGTMWCAHTVFLPAAAPTRSSIQWFAADPAAGTLQQRGLIDDPSAAIFYAFPSISVNRRNDVLIGYTRFTARDYPSAGFAFRAAADAPGAMQPGGIVKPGEAPYIGRGADEGSNRWGDFSATVVDPADGVTFWTIQEYAAVPTDHYLGRWATWWASVSVLATSDAVSQR
ncbi:MAG TPA: hypothetical protein VGS58_10050 [Candidatus Sulfopaludibacter sp.]|nr:hypothetical protein [Candidatus Sulfopaludibacter sp.]